MYPKNATYIIINTEVYSSSSSIWALYVSRIRDIQVKFRATADKLDRVLCSINIQSLTNWSTPVQHRYRVFKHDDDVLFKTFVTYETKEIT